MSEQVLLRFLDDEMAALGINYAYMEWKSAPKYPYFVGEYSESDWRAEDGGTLGEILLTGWTRGSYLELTAAKDRIKKAFAEYVRVDPVQHVCAAISYQSKLNVPTDDPELKSIQIRLGVSLWEV